MGRRLVILETLGIIGWGGVFGLAAGRGDDDYPVASETMKKNYGFLPGLVLCEVVVQRARGAGISGAHRLDLFRWFSKPGISYVD